MKKLILALVVMCMLFTMAGCEKNDKEKETTKPTTSDTPGGEEEDTPVVFEASFKDGFSHEDFQIANGWSNGGMFDCIWSNKNVLFEDDVMKLIIDEMVEGKYRGGEYRTNEFFGYGFYEVEMKPIKNVGVVSSFFTYTGPSDGNPWDEIDIEFLGKNTNIVQFNYFTNGVGNHERIHQLGFDASEEFHKYGFLWEEGKITWFVDGVAVHTADKDIPVTPSKIMMNVWPGKNVIAWLGKYDGTTPITAEYKGIKFTPIEIVDFEALGVEAAE
ncbi:MAG: glycosyl hydrolase family protein [Ruminococcus sp.]|nr:glycosyl hydrolase family protein [Ruminococcus sp.]